MAVIDIGVLSLELLATRFEGMAATRLKLTTGEHAPFENRSTLRGRFWRQKAKMPGAAAEYGSGNLERMKRGLDPQRFKDGKPYSLELSHEPTAYSEGGTRVVVRTPWEHAELDPNRYYKPYE